VLLFIEAIPLGIDSRREIVNAALAPDLRPKFIVLMFGFTVMLMLVCPFPGERRWSLSLLKGIADPVLLYRFFVYVA
jgi:hypothetical protein